MGVSIEMTKAYMESKGMRYRQTDDGKALICGIGGLDNAPDIDILVVFDDNDTGVMLRTYNICKFSEDKLQKMYKACSEQNAHFRWIRFYVNKEKDAVMCQDDAIIQPDTAGQEIFELMMRMAGIIDEAYPNFMKAMWA